MSKKNLTLPEPQAEAVTECLYQRLGGEDTIRQLSRAFYARVETDPLLRPMFRKDLARSGDLQAKFLTEALGGPNAFSKTGKTTDLRAIHASHRIGPEHVEAWLGHMEAAMKEAGIKGRERANLRCYFHDGTALLGDPLEDLYDLPLEELESRLDEDPSLSEQRGSLGWTLLHHAAARWDAGRVRLLAGRGALTRASSGHSPLYAAANRLMPLPERDSPAGKAVVETLIQHGAEVNARSGVGEQTALHMAARRGNTSVARALLEGGAEIDAKDRQGETPLRRAVNCGHEPMVRLLLERGADPHAPDHHGLTPAQAARKSGIVQLLQG